MPKLKIEQPELVKELADELREEGNYANMITDNDLVSSEAESVGEKADDTLDESVDEKRSELNRLAEDGDIKQSVKRIRKDSAKVIYKIYYEFETRQANRTNAFLTDVLISRFADLLEGLNIIESNEELDKELKNDKLLRRDLTSLVELVLVFQKEVFWW